MTLTFDHQGKQYLLYKRAESVKAHAAGQLTDSELAAKSWMFRHIVAGKRVYHTLPSNDKDAVKAAKDILRGVQSAPSDYAEFLAQREARRSLTIGALSQEWLAAGLPFNNVKGRDLAAAETLRQTMTRALPWWADKPIATITPNTHEQYAAHRRPALRSCDVELSCLSSLCNWGVLTGRITSNPFAKRTKFAEVKVHCHEACPEDDEVLHRMLGCMFQPVADAHHQAAILTTILAAGSLAFSALTGLRPGEPSLLLRLPPLDEAPTQTRDLRPGTIFRDRMGLLRMKVTRLKRGQNPFVQLHPAAERFLASWRAWLARTKVNDDEATITAWLRLAKATAPEFHITIRPDDRPLFPLGTEDLTTLNRALNRASKTLDLPHFKPHGFGRAYYVKVRRSMGEDDSTISSELGQNTDADLIRSVYGDPNDLVGGNLFDWLPDTMPPAWELLANSRAPVASSKPQPVAA